MFRKGKSMDVPSGDTGLLRTFTGLWLDQSHQKQFTPVGDQVSANIYTGWSIDIYIYHTIILYIYLGLWTIYQWSFGYMFVYGNE